MSCWRKLHRRRGRVLVSQGSVINDHKLDGLQQQPFFFFFSLIVVEMRCLKASCLLGWALASDPRGNSVPCVFQLLMAPSLPWLWLRHPNPSHCLLPFSVYLFYTHILHLRTQDPPGESCMEPSFQDPKVNYVFHHIR